MVSKLFTVMSCMVALVAASTFTQFGLSKLHFPKSLEEVPFDYYDDMSDSRDLEDTAALCLSWCLGKTECRATVTIFIDRETACFLFVKEFDSSQEDIGTMAMLDIPQETLESKSSFSPEEYLGSFTLSQDIVTFISQSISPGTYYAYNVHTSQQTQSAKTPRSKGLDVKTPGSSGLFTSPGLMKISTIVRSDKAKEVVTTPGTVKKSSIVSAREFKQFGLMESPFDDPQSPKGGFLYKFDERHALKDIAALCLSWCLRSTSCQATVTFRHFRYNACFLFEQEFETYYHEDERTLVPLGITPETLEEKSSKFKEVPSTPFAIMSLDLVTNISESISKRTYYAYNVYTSQQTQSEKTPSSMKKGSPPKVATAVKKGATHGSRKLTFNELMKSLTSETSARSNTKSKKNWNKKFNGKKNQ